MSSIGPLELFIVLAVILLMFGAKRLPELGHGVGRGLHDFAKGLKGEDDEVEPARVEAPVAAAVPAPVAAPAPADAPADAARRAGGDA